MSLNPLNSEIEIQRSYYRDTAQIYDQLHVHEKDVHYFALTFMAGMIEFLECDRSYALTDSLKDA